jgi:hypothetical protein
VARNVFGKWRRLAGNGVGSCGLRRVGVARTRPVRGLNDLSFRGVGLRLAKGVVDLNLAADFVLGLRRDGVRVSGGRLLFVERSNARLRILPLALDVGGSVWCGRLLAYSFRYSRSRRVCVRLTGISVAFASFIRRR